MSDEEIKVLVVLECRGLGDIISSTPAIRAMATQLYMTPISVATHSPEFFKNFPYVDKVFNINQTIRDYHVIKTFNIDKIKKRELLHEKVDIRQFHSLCCGFMLLPEQMNCDYYPDLYEPIDLPDKYMVLHPSRTWESRTWTPENWRELAIKLNDAGITMVTVGKTDNTAPDCPKEVFKLDNVLDLTDQLSLSQCWHVLNKAKGVVTMDSGILHLAGTTDTDIVQLGSSIHPYFRAPYRDGTQHYKYHYVKGSCNLFCASSVSYMLRGIPFKISKCAEEYETFECHPPVDKVIKKVVSIYN
tara:strand:+ start:6329 stop:7231 length:903 start_codon:yes stop_codon:yes gene_type:complete